MLGTNGDSLGIRQLHQRIKELEEKNKTFEDYNKDLNNKLDKLNEEYITLEKDYGTSEIENDKLRKRINKAIEYIRSNYTITDDDLYLALYSGDGTLGKLENILEGKENE